MPYTACDVVHTVAAHASCKVKTSKRAAQPTQSLCPAGLNVERLERLLQAGILMGLFTQIQGTPGRPVKYKNNNLSATLRKDHPSSICKLVSTRNLVHGPCTCTVSSFTSAATLIAAFCTVNVHQLSYVRSAKLATCRAQPLQRRLLHWHTDSQIG